MQIIRRAIASAIGVTIVGFSVSANAYPQLRYMGSELNSDVDNCLQKSVNAVRRNKYQDLEIRRNNRYNRNFIEAYKYDMTKDYIGSHPFVINLIYIYLFTPLARKAHKPQRLYFK